MKSVLDWAICNPVAVFIVFGNLNSLAKKWSTD
jgi:hypothetical protein